MVREERRNLQLWVVGDVRIPRHLLRGVQEGPLVLHLHRHRPVAALLRPLSHAPHQPHSSSRSQIGVRRSRGLPRHRPDLQARDLLRKWMCASPSAIHLFALFTPFIDLIKKLNLLIFSFSTMMDALPLQATTCTCPFWWCSSRSTAATTAAPTVQTVKKT